MTPWEEWEARKDRRKLKEQALDFLGICQNVLDEETEEHQFILGVEAAYKKGPLVKS